MADLTHTDWLLFTQRALIQQIDSNITTNIVKGEKNYLILSNLTKVTLPLLKFITNTDQNNNYLYLDGFSVYEDGGILPNYIPGLSSIIKNLYRYSDATAAYGSVPSRTHFPFVKENLTASPSSKGPKSYTDMDDFVTVLSTTLPKSACESLGGKQLRYEIILKASLESSDSENNKQSSMVSPKIGLINSFHPDT